MLPGSTLLEVTSIPVPKPIGNFFPFVIYFIVHMQVLVCDLHISILNEILFINGLFLKRAAPGLFFPLYQHHKLCSFQRAFSGPPETALLHKPNAQILLVSAVNHRCSS